MSINWEYALASTEIAEVGGYEAFKKLYFHKGIINASKIWLPVTITTGIISPLVVTLYQKWKLAKESDQLLEVKSSEFEEKLKKHIVLN